MYNECWSVRLENITNNLHDIKKAPHRCEALVPGAGIEPALPKELDFESSASTNSATRAS